MRLTIIILIAFFMLLPGCNPNKDSNRQPEKIAHTDSFFGQIVADTIIYDVIIHNTNPEDEWTEQTLQYLKHRTLIDSIFELVYNKEAIAYDFFEKTPLKIKDIKKIEEEPGFSRDKIGKIQFTEKWYFDASSVQMQKEVLSIVLGYDLMNSDGTLRGHKPVFKLYLNH